MISFVIDVAFIGFLIWDSIAHGGAVSGSQLAFGIIKMDCLKEVAIAIVEVLSLIFPSGVVYTRDRSGTGHRGHRGRRSHHDIWQCGTPNDTRMRADDRWLSETDDPPDSLLTASISSVPVGLERYGLCFHGDPLQRDREYYQLQRRGLIYARHGPIVRYDQLGGAELLCRL